MSRYMHLGAMPSHIGLTLIVLKENCLPVMGNEVCVPFFSEKLDGVCRAGQCFKLKRVHLLHKFEL